MKKTLVLTSLLAIVATTGAATAATDVTFAGDYLLPDGTSANVASDVSGATYTYQKSDGTDAPATAYNEDPNLTYFTYTDKNGDAADLTSGIGLTASDFDGASAATGDVNTTQTIEAGQTASRDNYTYVNGKGDTVTLGESAQSFTQTHTLLDGVSGANIELADGYITSVDVTDGTAVGYTSLDGTKYILHASNNQDYYLNEDGSKVIWAFDASEVNEAELALIAPELDALKDAYSNDTASIATLITNTGAWAADEATNFAAADAVFTTDSNKIAELTSYYNEYTDALTALNNANVAKEAAGEANTENLAYQTAARDVYNSSIEGMFDGKQDALTAAQQSAVDSGITADKVSAYDDYATEIAGKQDALTAAQQSAVDSGITATKVNQYDDVVEHMGTIHGLVTSAGATTTSTGKAYHGNLAVGTTMEEHLLALDEAIGDRRTLSGNHVSATGSVTDNLQSLNDDLDTEVARAQAEEASIRSDFAAADALTLSNAKSYADSGDALTLNAAKAYADNASSLNLQAAKAYTDERIHKLDKDLSAGVANAVALSSVAVSNVERGEVSVGAGYGYYNGQSAMAFGAAMGLSNRWSINAGAGLSGSDFSIRAGTNYKFKLF